MFKRFGWQWPNSTVYTKIPVFWDVTLCHRASSSQQTYCSFATRVSQLKIQHFWVIGIERNVCRCTFNRYSVITQFEKIATEEQLCHRCTHRKLQRFRTFKSFSWKIVDFEMWHCCGKWVISYVGFWMFVVRCVGNARPVTQQPHTASIFQEWLLNYSWTCKHLLGVQLVCSLDRYMHYINPSK